MRDTEEEEEKTTKICPYCGNDRLILLPTQNVKLCTNKLCYKEIPWYKDEGQQRYY